MDRKKHCIHIDQAGYQRNMKKTAVITVPSDSFSVISEDGRCVFNGSTVHFGACECSGDDVYIADFSELNECGSYRLITESGECSHVFLISDDVYQQTFNALSKAFYYLRCGCGLKKEHAGVFSHAPCHTEKALVWDDRSISLDVSGGWHDAGDYGRYVTAGACALAHLLYAYKLYPDAFDAQDLCIPESGGMLPDILAECQVELDWIMKLQRSDGAVYHKATTKGHAPFIMPEDDREQMYLLPPSSMATADTAAVMALAATVYNEFDSVYAEKLKQCALKSYEWLENNPDMLFQNRPECTTGGYGERSDRDNRLWAAAELFSLTGEDRFHKTFMELLKEDMHLTALGYADMGGLAALSYILCENGDESIKKDLKQSYINEAYHLSELAEKNGYGVTMAPYHFNWGSNMTVMKHAMVLLLAYRFTGEKKLEQHAAAQLHYLLGTNATGYCYVSGIGTKPINYPHLRPSHADGVEECIPGMVSGGANRGRNDPDAKILIPDGTAPMKCFADDFRCYSLNEITIYWNSPAVFAFAHFISAKELLDN